MLKNCEKNLQKCKNKAKNHSRMSKNCEKLRKPRKTVKIFEKPVKNRQKYRKIV